jgi:hypothetical protein
VVELFHYLLQDSARIAGVGMDFGVHDTRDTFLRLEHRELDTGRAQGEAYGSLYPMLHMCITRFRRVWLSFKAGKTVSSLLAMTRGNCMDRCHDWFVTGG